MYKICFYVPQDYVDRVKNALFKSGAGHIGNYQCCAWQTLGEGQFMPLENSQAFIGEKNTLEKVLEYKVELVCDTQHIKAAIQALKESHPYEEVAYQVFRLENF